MPPTRPFHALPSAVLVASLAACAGAPPVSVHTPANAAGSDPAAAAARLDCRELAAAIAKTDDARRAALDRQHDAWKVVVPFAVAARYASARSAFEDADRQLGALAAQSASQGCADRSR